MNRIFKVVFNKALGVFTATSELAKANGKKSVKAVAAAAVMGLSMMAFSGEAMADVVGEIRVGPEGQLQKMKTGSKQWEDVTGSVTTKTEESDGYVTAGRYDPTSQAIILERHGYEVVRDTNGDIVYEEKEIDGKKVIVAKTEPLGSVTVDMKDFKAEGDGNTKNTGVSGSLSGTDLTISVVDEAGTVTSDAIDLSGLKDGNTTYELSQKTTATSNETKITLTGSDSKSSSAIIRTDDTATITENDGAAVISVKETTYQADTGSVSVKPGETLNVKGGATGNLTDNNIGVVAETVDGQKQLTVKLAKDVDLGADGSLTASGVTISNGQIIGDKFAITNDGGAVLAGGDVRVDGDGTVRVGGEGNSAKTTLYKDGTISNKVGDTTFQTNAGGVLLQNGSNAVVVSKDGVGIAGNTAVNGNMAVNGNLNMLSNKITNVAAGEADTDAVNVAQLNSKNVTMEVTKGDDYGTGSATIKQGNNEIGNIAAGENVKITGSGQNMTISAKDTRNTVEAGKNIEVTSVTQNDGSLKYTVKTKDNIEVTSVKANKVESKEVKSDKVQVGDSIVFQQGNVNMGGNRVQGVAAGTADTDAVNFAQLKATEAQFNQRMNSMDRHIDRVEDNAYAGVAMALATAGLPQSWQPGKSMIAMAAGTYMGEQGYAIGVSHNTENGKWSFKATASGNSQGHWGGSVGAGYMW